jgi:hypothetical protein
MATFNMGATSRGEYQIPNQTPEDVQNYQSKAAFENFLREQGDTAYVDQYVQENPDKFLTPAQLYKLQQVGPEAFWGGSTQGGDTGSSKSSSVGFDSLIPKDNNGSPFSYSEYNSDGWLVAHYADGSTKYIVQDPSKRSSTTSTKAKTPEQLAAEALAAEKTANRKSAYDLLYQQFNALGLGSLVEPLKALITDASFSPSEFAIKLQETDAYKNRFSANQARIAKGLRALSPAEYIGLEDQYQNIMRTYGLPESYYTKGDLGKQAGFEKLIANDVSNIELEDRIQTAYDRVIKSNPEISDTLKRYYPEISNGDILAYALDPQNALKDIQRKVTAAEIGGAAAVSGLSTDMKRAEQLAGYGVNKQLAQQGYTTIAGGLERGKQLSELYQQQPYTQQTAEQEVFNLAGGTEAARQRRKIAGLETATFGGKTGAGGAFDRERAGAI